MQHLFGIQVKIEFIDKDFSISYVGTGKLKWSELRFIYHNFMLLTFHGI